MSFVAFAAAFSVLSGVVGFAQQRSAGKAQQRVANYQATLAGRRADAMEQEAGQARAIGQREAAEDRRQARFIRSRALAVMGGSGTAIDTDILADIDTEAELRSLTSLQKGEQTARSLEYDAVLQRAGAEGLRQAGEAEKRAANQRAVLTLAGGVGQASALYAKYGDGGPDSQWGIDPISSTTYSGPGGSLSAAHRSQWGYR